MPAPPGAVERSSIRHWAVSGKPLIHDLRKVAVEKRRAVVTGRLSLVLIAAVLGGCTAAPALTPAAPLPTNRPTVPPPKPTPTPAPTTPPFAVGTLTYTSPATVGSAITLSVKVTNTGTRSDPLVFGVSGLDDQTFVGCKPKCATAANRFQIPAPAPGKAATYELVWQATHAGRLSVFATVGSGIPFDYYSRWSVDIVVLL